MKSVRIWYRKEGAAKYMSHLDLVRVMGRVFHRAGIPLWYTEGFNPIPKLTFASPLSVGCGGENELAQFKLTEDADDKAILERLKAAMPEGITVKEAYSSPSSFKEIAWAQNVIDMHCDAGDDTVPMLYLKFASSVVVLKKTKSTEKEVDISPFIRDFSAERTDYGVRITVVTRADNTNYLNPEYVAQAAAAVADPENRGYHTIMRQFFMFEDGSIFR